MFTIENTRYSPSIIGHYDVHVVPCELRVKVLQIYLINVKVSFNSGYMNAVPSVSFQV
jgi:hypothetical protein